MWLLLSAWIPCQQSCLQCSMAHDAFSQLLSTVRTMISACWPVGDHFLLGTVATGGCNWAMILLGSVSMHVPVQVSQASKCAASLRRWGTPSPCQSAWFSRHHQASLTSNIPQGCFRCTVYRPTSSKGLNKLFCGCLVHLPSGIIVGPLHHTAQLVHVTDTTHGERGLGLVAYCGS